MSLDDIRAGARKLERRIAWRNGREYLAAVIVTAMFGQAIWQIPSTMARLGLGLIIVGVAFVVYYLHTHGSVRPLPEEFGAASAVAFLRGQLIRQRDLLRSVWLWYMLPLVPGMVLFLAAVARHVPPDRAWRVVAIGGGGMGVLLVGGHLLNRYAASRIQARIDALPSPD